MMKRLITVTGLAVLLVVISGLYIKARTEGTSKEIAEQDVMKLTVEMAGYNIKKIWEGEIDGRRTAYIRAEKEGKSAGIIVVIQDELPEFFKRIEYVDEDADSNLDMVKMKVYEAARGWRYIGITKENKYGLGFANEKYNSILKKIKGALPASFTDQ